MIAEDAADGTVPGDNCAVVERTERLRRAIREAGGATAIAKRAKLHVGTLNNYLGGRDMKASNLVALAEAAGVRLEWLALGTGPMHEGETNAALVSPDAAGLPSMTGAVVIARYDVRASAGRNGAVSDGHVVERIQFSEEWVRVKLRRDPQSLCLLEACGDSMEPTIRNGDVLMLDTAIDGLISGRIYVADLGGELLVKRIQRRLNGQVLVISDNDRYPPEEISPVEVEQLRIIGEVVWHGRIV